jgi:hypothetical protein
MVAVSNSFDGFQMPDGARAVRRQDDEFEMSISVPADEDGFFGRQCPGCSQLFRVHTDDYQALPDEIELWCVYCGHQAEHSDFITQQQLDRAKHAVADYGMQLIGRELDNIFGRLSTPRPRSGFGIQISYRSTPFYPQPLPGIDEERLIRIRQCPSCSLRYAIFGEHRFCPQCGSLPSRTIALDALVAETTRLDALALLPAEAAATLREQGVFTRIWVDTLENLVGIVESMTGAAFRTAVADADLRLRGKGNIFQRLDDTAELFMAAGYPDLRSTLDSATWQRLLQAWATRHAFTHNDGIVDAKYLVKIPTSALREGQRIIINESACRQAIADTRTLCEAVNGLVGI